MIRRRRFSTAPLRFLATGLLILLAMSAALAARAQGGVTAPADAPDAGAFRATGPAAATLVPGRLTPPYHSGWPQTMGTHVNYKPVGIVLADVDADGLKEVLAGSTDNLFRVWRHDGTLMPGWPVNVGGLVQSKAAAADLDGDGDLEILISVVNGPLRVYHHNGTVFPGWPQVSGVTYGFVAPTVYDLDADGTPEVMIGGGATVRAWRADGTPLFATGVGSNVTGTLAVGDINNDGAPEVVAVTLPGTLCALDHHGVALPGSPATFGLVTSWAAPSIGDIDADGQNETLVVGYRFMEYSSLYVYRWTPTGPAILAGFPVSFPGDQDYSCPVIGDADGDGDLEIWNAPKSNGPTFHAWDHTGAALPGWPVTADPNMEGSAILVDFDGMPNTEAAIGDNWNPGVIFGHNLNGTIATNFPLPKPGASGPNSPEVGDVDGDGLLELGFTMMTGDVALWDFPVAYADAGVEWGALFHDDWNTNQYGFIVPGSGAGIDAIPVARGLGPLRLVPNPTCRSVAIQARIDDPEQVQLRVFDLQGREIVRAFSGGLAPGQSELVWDGRDAAGRRVPAGVYRVRYEGARSGIRTGRVVILH